MGRHIGGGHRVAIGEQPVQLSTNETACHALTQRAGRQSIVDAVVQITGVGPIGLDRVGVGPGAKGARQLAIAKLPPGDIVAVFEPPGEFQRAIADWAERDAIARADSAGPLDDLELLPGGSQTLEGSWPFVPTKDSGSVGRCRDA